MNPGIERRQLQRVSDEAADRVWADRRMQELLAKVTAERDELLTARARSKLLPLDSAPTDRNQYIRVYTFEVFRWLPYKPNSNEFKQGRRGRWQKHNGYGFENAELIGLGFQLLGDDGNPIATGDRA